MNIFLLVRVEPVEDETRMRAAVEQALVEHLEGDAFDVAESEYDIAYVEAIPASRVDIKVGQ